MKINLKRLMVLLLVAFAGSIGANAQQDSARVSIIREVKYHGDMASLLASLAHTEGKVIGLETLPEKPRSTITLARQNVTFPQLLDAIVQAEPSYQWSEADSAIEVFPVNRTTSLLDTTIASFEVKDVSSEEAISRLLNVPEVQAYVRSMKLSSRSAGAAAKGGDKITLSMQGTTVRQVLDQIAADSGTKFWIFRTFPDRSFWVGTTYN
jgi:hypothetical protein